MKLKHIFRTSWFSKKIKNFRWTNEKVYCRFHKEIPSNPNILQIKNGSRNKTHSNYTQINTSVATNNLSNTNFTGGSSIPAVKNLNNFISTMESSSSDSIPNNTKVLNITDLPLCPDDPPDLGIVFIFLQ